MEHRTPFIEQFPHGPAEDSYSRRRDVVGLDSGRFAAGKGPRVHARRQRGGLRCDLPIPPWGKAKAILFNSSRGSGAAITIEILAYEAIRHGWKLGPDHVTILLDRDDIAKLARADTSYESMKKALAEVTEKYWKEYIEPLHYPEAKPRERDEDGYPIYDD